MTAPKRFHSEAKCYPPAGRARHVNCAPPWRARTRNEAIVGPFHARPCGPRLRAGSANLGLTSSQFCPTAGSGTPPVGGALGVRREPCPHQESPLRARTWPRRCRGRPPATGGLLPHSTPPPP